MRLTDGARAVWARTHSLTPPSWLGPFGREPWIVLGPLILVQWLALIVFMVTVRHNSWLYYQGGDETFYWTHRLVVRALAPADRGGRLGLVVSAQPAGRGRRQHRPLRPAGDHPRRHARAAPGCAARDVRNRRPDRRAHVRLLDGRALDRAAVHRDPALRPALPRQVHRADAAADVRADAARRLPVDGAADRRRVPRRPWPRHARLARGGARRARRRLRLLREALERGLLRGTPGCVPDRAALAPGPLLRGRGAPGTAARGALEAARARARSPSSPPAPTARSRRWPSRSPSACSPPGSGAT